MQYNAMDPHTDPWGPYLYGSGIPDPPSTSKKMKKSLDFYLLFCDFFMTFYLWRMMKMYFQKGTIKKLIKIIFCWQFEGHWRKEKDPDPYQNVTFPEHWFDPWLPLSTQSFPPPPSIAIYVDGKMSEADFKDKALSPSCRMIDSSPPPPVSKLSLFLSLFVCRW